MAQIIGKHELLLGSLYKFYNEENMSKIIPILNQDSNVSLRILDWLVTNYAKKHNIAYQVPAHRTMETQSKPITRNFNIYLNYKTQLKAYSKKQFDPFCRRERIVFKPIRTNNHEKEAAFVTTIGQLNFFRWTLQNKVLEYADQHLTEIEEDMVHSLHNRYEYQPKRSSGSFDGSEPFSIVDESAVKKATRKKRNELSKSAAKIMTRTNPPGGVKIDFYN